MDSIVTNQVAKRRTIPGYFFRLYAFVVAFFTLIAGWCSVFPPSPFWFMAFLGLGFPILFLLNAVNLTLLFLARKRSVLAPLAAMIFTISKIPLLVQVSGAGDPGANDTSFKVMSYNVRLFDLYNWSHNKETRDKIIEFIQGESPDILCLQEFFTSENKPLRNLEIIRKHLGHVEIHSEYPINLFGTDHFGMATISKFPQVGKGVLYFDKKTSNMCIYTDLRINIDTIRVYNCHLQSIRFGERDYKFLREIQNMEEDTEQDPILRTSNIFNRMKFAYQKRTGQAKLIADHIRSSPYPVIVCGDFNDTPISYVYETISGDLCDGFRESGNGWGSTYAGPIPGLRIDYLFHSESLNSSGFKVHSEKLSDHYAISATLGFQQGEN